jgi:two-component system alkaline phosphatase synthesis response regulator PhoP
MEHTGYASGSILFCIFGLQFPDMENKDIRILLADDEADILEFLGYNLSREGYQVIKAKNGAKALEKAKEHLPQLIILDVMMPGMDGIETCAEIRKIPDLTNSLIAFLTARGEDYSQIAGFEAGADDYITKPIKPKVFLSRIQALLRRYKAKVPEPETAVQLVRKEFIIDRERFMVIRDGKETFLPKKEFELLHFLASYPNKVFSREEIFQNVWGNDVVVGDRTIDVHIRRIRERLEIDSIKTIKGVGYKYEEK